MEHPFWSQPIPSTATPLIMRCAKGIFAKGILGCTGFSLFRWEKGSETPSCDGEKGLRLPRSSCSDLGNEGVSDPFPHRKRESQTFHRKRGNPVHPQIPLAENPLSATHQLRTSQMNIHICLLSSLAPLSRLQMGRALSAIHVGSQEYNRFPNIGRPSQGARSRRRTLRGGVLGTFWKPPSKEPFLIAGASFLGIEMSFFWYRGGPSLLFGIEISFLVSRSPLWYRDLLDRLLPGIKCVLFGP